MVLGKTKTNKSKCIYKTSVSVWGFIEQCKDLLFVFCLWSVFGPIHAGCVDVLHCNLYKRVNLT